MGLILEHIFTLKLLCCFYFQTIDHDDEDSTIVDLISVDGETSLLSSFHINSNHELRLSDDFRKAQLQGFHKLLLRVSCF